jgi:hypothetical protein
LEKSNLPPGEYEYIAPGSYSSETVILAERSTEGGKKEMVVIFLVGYDVVKLKDIEEGAVFISYERIGVK